MQQFNNIPVHITIIMDGNRRWAKKRGQSVLSGHKYALDHTVEELVEEAGKIGIPYITFWAWSTENWERGEKEVSGMMRLILYAIRKKVQSFQKKGAKLKIIGDISKFPASIQSGIQESIEKTKANNKITVTFGLNYGGRDEIIRTIKKIPPPLLNNLTIEQFNNLLDTSGIPDPDMIIRTGGEKRLSGFMPWQSEYSELYFTDVLFPDFKKEEFKKAVNWFTSRNRRFGK